MNTASDDGNGDDENTRALAKDDAPVSGYSATLVAVTSPVTLAECLVVPLRKANTDLQRAFTDLIVRGKNVVFVTLNDATARQAAELRARYNLSLTDAFQAAAALTAGCDGLLTNDPIFKRVTELDVIVLDEVESDDESDDRVAAEATAES